MLFNFLSQKQTNTIETTTVTSRSITLNDILNLCDDILYIHKNNDSTNFNQTVKFKVGFPVKNIFINTIKYEKYDLTIKASNDKNNYDKPYEKLSIEIKKHFSHQIYRFDYTTTESASIKAIVNIYYDSFKKGKTIDTDILNSKIKNICETRYKTEMTLTVNNIPSEDIINSNNSDILGLELLYQMLNPLLNKYSEFKKNNCIYLESALTRFNPFDLLSKNDRKIIKDVTLERTNKTSDLIINHDTPINNNISERMYNLCSTDTLGKHLKLLTMTANSLPLLYGTKLTK